MTMTDDPVTTGGAVGAVDDRNRAWNLKSFMDSLIVELDRAQDALAVKGLTRPVTYTVKDVDVDLRCFPQYDGRSVRFRTAQPGQDGSSGLRFSLGSISAGTIRDSTPPPPGADDVRLDAIEDLAPEALEALEAVGVRSGRDLQRIAARGVDLRTATGNRSPDYGDLAAMITKSTRRRLPPRIRAASLAIEDGVPVLHLDGENLCIDSAEGYPYVLVDGQHVDVESAGPNRISLRSNTPTASRVAMALDPFALVTMELRPS